MAAGLTKVSELAISPGEAAALAGALVEVEKHYPVSVDPKYVAIGQLVMVAAGVYAPKVFTYKSRLRAERDARRAEEARDVSPGPVDPAAFSGGFSNG